MQRALPSWIAEAAERAERRLVGFRSCPTPARDLDRLIKAIMDPKVNRDQLRRLAKAVSAGEAA